MDSYFVVCNCPRVIFVTLNFLLIYVKAKINMLTTPGGVEHNEGIFVRIEYGGLEVGSH